MEFCANVYIKDLILNIICDKDKIELHSRVNNVLNEHKLHLPSLLNKMKVYLDFSLKKDIIIKKLTKERSIMIFGTSTYKEKCKKP